jgi:hypothetical protein
VDGRRAIYWICFLNRVLGPQPTWKIDNPESFDPEKVSSQLDITSDYPISGRDENLKYFSMKV